MINALVPVKRLDAAKSRLRDALGGPATERLALAMLEDVVAALRSVRRLALVAVVTPDPSVAESARRAGAIPLLGPDPGLNASLERGAKELAPTRWRPHGGAPGRARTQSPESNPAALLGARPTPPGAGSALPDLQAALLVVLGDVAGVRGGDVEALLDALESLDGRGVVVAPSADGGTSALLRAPPDAIPSRFGPESARAHREEAERGRTPYRELDLPSLRVDLDTEEDLRAFLTGPGDGPHTRRLLRELGFGTRP